MNKKNSEKNHEKQAKYYAATVAANDIERLSRRISALPPNNHTITSADIYLSCKMTLPDICINAESLFNVVEATLLGKYPHLCAENIRYQLSFTKGKADSYWLDIQFEYIE